MCFLWVVKHWSTSWAICSIDIDILNGCVMAMWNFKTFTAAWKAPFKFHIGRIGIHAARYWYRFIQRCTNNGHRRFNTHGRIYKIEKENNNNTDKCDYLKFPLFRLQSIESGNVSWQNITYRKCHYIISFAFQIFFTVWLKLFNFLIDSETSNQISMN